MPKTIEKYTADDIYFYINDLVHFDYENGARSDNLSTEKKVEFVKFKDYESEVQELKDKIDTLELTNFILRSSSMLKNGKDKHQLIFEIEKLQKENEELKRRVNGMPFRKIRITKKL